MLELSTKSPADIRRNEPARDQVLFSNTPWLPLALVEFKNVT